MYAVAGRPTLQHFERRSEVLQYVTVDEFDFTGRRHESDQSRNTVGNRAIMLIARAQRLTGSPEVLNVGVRSTPFNDLTGFIRQRASVAEEPAILSIEAPQPRFHFAWLARS